MGILSRIFGAPEAIKESASGRINFIATARGAQWTKRNYDGFAREGYQRNVVAYQAINKTADAVAAIPWNLFQRKTELSEHPLLTLLDRPNPMQSGPQFMRSLVGFYRISGNGYIERVSIRGREVRELYALRPDRMTVIPGQNGMPRGYMYSAAGVKHVWDADPMSGDSGIRHIKTFNPLDDWYGLSPIDAGAFAVDQHNQTMEWIQALLQNSAMPSGAFEVVSEGGLTDEQFDRLKAQIDEQYSGSRNAGRPMLLEGGMKWSQMGLSPDDMKAIETKHSSARDVSLALGVPPLLLNIPADSTYNNYKEARLAFYEETVIPLAEMICDELNNWLVPAFGDGLRLELDIDAIPAIAEKRQEMWSMADASSDLTINEKRAIKGYEPIDNGDDVLVSSSLIPLNMAVEPLPAPEPLNPGAKGLLSPSDLRALAYGETP